jgi:hypothetical protein
MFACWRQASKASLALRLIDLHFRYLEGILTKFPRKVTFVYPLAKVR